VKTARNVAIVLALAAAVALIPAGGFAAGLLLWLLGLAFWGILAWFFARLYREHRMSLFMLDDRMRALLYVSIGVAVLTVSATRRLWDTPAGVIAWFALIAGASYGVFAVWQYSRRY
jgi:O-antigen/teichoic acid export membrane protein